jgi:hypothetical protein
MKNTRNLLKSFFKTLSLLMFILIHLSIKSQIHKCSHKSHPTFHTKNSADDNLRSDTIDVLNYTIEIDFLNIASQNIKGSCQVKFRTFQNNINTLSLDLLQMTVDSVKQGNFLNSFTYNDTLLIISLENTLNSGIIDSLTVFYNGTPQGDPSGWGGFYFQGNYAYNLGVGFAAKPHNYGRVWHPCFDNFVERATYDITLITPSSLRGYANGVIESEIDNGTSFTRNWKMNQKIPTYLACVAVSNYTHVSQSYPSTLQGINIPVQLIAVPNDTNNFKNSFVNLFGAMDAFESSYGPYLWDKVGFHLVPFNSGAMEHATSIAYPQITANGTIAYETLMAHELAHSWWGNLVTCRTAEDMWINEGMASYSERIFLENVYDYNRYLAAIKSNHKDVLLNAHIKDSGYYALHEVPHNITYGDHSYNKGADVAHTLRSYMGDSEFFSGIQSFLIDNAFLDVDAYDFRDHLNANTNVDVTDFFNDWIFNPGFPGFVIDSFQVFDNGGIYEVKSFVQQKLKGTHQYFSNVPMEITYMDNNWNSFTETVNLNGQYSITNSVVNFEPTLVFLNLNDKIGQAVTGTSEIIKNTGLKDLNYPMFRYTVTNSGIDSNWVRIEHYWVAPDEFKTNENEWLYHISEERFWKVDGIFSEGFEANGRVFFNGRNVVNGNLDNLLTSQPGFHEDSLRLLYRVNSKFEWKEVVGYTIANLGSPTDGYGYINFDHLLKGEYTFGWRKSSVSVSENIKKEKQMKVFPNPTQDILKLDLDLPFSSYYEIHIYNSMGIQVLKKPFFMNFLNVSNLSSGFYTITIFDQKNKSFVSKTTFIKE